MAHSDLRSFQCPSCPKSFKSSSGLSYHQAFHCGVRPFSCGICSTSFTVRSYLTDHITSVHTNEDSQQCPTCKKIFKSCRRLKAHSIIHSELRPHICTICKKGFKSKDHLKVHGVVHLKTKQHKCPFCDKSFKCQNYLTVHLRVHTRENLQKCPTCSKEFKTATELRRHAFTHSNLRPFLCDHCPQKFKTQAYLSTHLKTLHVDEKHFKCTDCPRTFGTNRELGPECGKAFGTKDRLEVHQIRHTQIIEFECILCEFVAGSDGKLEEHMKIHAGKVLDNQILNLDLDLVPNNAVARSWECEKCGAGSVGEKYDLARQKKTRRCLKQREGNPIMRRELRICLTRIDE